MGLLEAREDVTWAAPILVLILPHDLLTATEVVRHLLLSVLQGAVHSAVKNWIFILISLKFTWGELCKRPGLRLQIGSMPTSQLTRGSANDLWTFHWVSLCPNSIHWCVELYQLSNYKYDYTRILGPDGPIILAVDLRNTPEGGGYKPTHCFIYID